MIGFTHALFSIFLFLHTIFLACSVPGQSFVTSDVCFDQTSAAMQIYYMGSYAFFFNDLLTVKYIFGGQGNMVRDTYIHHAICIGALTAALSYGRFIGIYVAITQGTEVSTMPLSIRSIMKECKIDKSYAKTFLYNGYTLLFTFFLFRAVYLTVMSFWYVAPWYFNKYELDVQL